MSDTIRTLIWPAAGLNHKMGYRGQPPFSTPDALNVVPFDALEGRMRGGSRPGLKKAFPEQIGPCPIHFLGKVSVVQTAVNNLSGIDGVVGAGNQWLEKFMYMAFGGNESPARTLGFPPEGRPFWEDAPWLAKSPLIRLGDTNPQSAGGTFVIFTSSSGLGESWNNEERGALSRRFDFTTDFDYSFRWEYRWTTDVSSTSSSLLQGFNAGSNSWGSIQPLQFRFWLCLDENSPNVEQDGLQVTITPWGPAVNQDRCAARIVVESWTGGAKTTLVSTTVAGGFFRESTIRIDYQAGSDTFRVLNGNVILASGLAAPNSNRKFGFSMRPNRAAGMYNTLEMRSMTLLSLSEGTELGEVAEGFTAITRRDVLVAVACGKMYRESLTGVMEEVPGPSLTSQNRIFSAEHLQKLYFADYDDNPIENLNGQVNGLEFSAGGFDFEDAGIDTAFAVRFLNLPEEITQTDYAIASVDGGLITLAESPTEESLIGLAFRILRRPKFYNPKTNALEAWEATAGTVPLGCKIIVRWRDRIVMSGNPEDPTAIYMSALGNPFDWDYGQLSVNPASALVLAATRAGMVGEPVTALIPHNDQKLIIGCTNSVWQILADPADGGRVVNVTENLGILGQASWCYTPNQTLVVLTNDGIWEFSTDAMQLPQSVSRESLPREFLDIDVNTLEISLMYDLRYRRIHVYLTRKDGSRNTHWYFDWETKGFWKVRFLASHEALSVLDFRPPQSNDRTILLGCRDGYIRRYDELLAEDDGEPFASYVVIGPIPLIDTDFSEGKFGDLQCAMGEGSGPVTWSIQAGDTYEQATKASPIDQGTWQAGDNFRNYPRGRGAAYLLRLEGQGEKAWAFERVTVRTRLSGRRRR